MTDYIPPQALADARAVIRAQDPDVSAAAEQRHSRRDWRNAINHVMKEPRGTGNDDAALSGRADIDNRCVGVGASGALHPEQLSLWS